MRKLILALAVGLLAACATVTPYQRGAPGAGAYGFHEERIENDRVRLTFRGNSVTDRQTVENYLLYRAAELTLSEGKDYFVVATRDTEEHSRLQGDSFGHYGYGFDYWYFSPRHGWGGWYDPFWGDPVNYREVTRYEAIAEIVMYSGAKPADNANAFDAREVQANLQAQIVRPPPAG